MPVPVVGIGDVWVVVRQCQMPVPVAVRLLHRPVVLVGVMLVVGVGVLVLEGVVGVLVAVPGCEKQGDTGCQEQARGGIARRGALAEERNGQGGAREGGGREEGRLASGAEEP